MNRQRGTSKEVKRHSHGPSAELSDHYLPIRRSYRTNAHQFIMRLFRALTEDLDPAVGVEIKKVDGKLKLEVREL